MLHLPIPKAHLAELHHVLKGGNGHIDGRGQARILDTRHRVVSYLHHWLIDGQMEWDTTQWVTRTAACTVLDPDGRVGLDSTSVTDTNVRLDRYLQLRRDIWLPHAETWVSIPLFTGPISGVERSGDTIEIAAEGKESIAMMPLWREMSWPKGTPRVQIIEDLMRRRAGEHSLSLPSWRTPIGRDYRVWRDLDTGWYMVWRQALYQADALGAQLFYDARGTLRLRKRPVRPLWTFTADEMEGKPAVKERSKDIVNQIVVTGGVPKGGKHKVSVTRSLPRSHPHSPGSLGRRHGADGSTMVGRRFIEHIEDETIITKSAAVTVADRRLREHAQAVTDVTMTTLPMLMLEPHDLFRVDAYDVAGTARAHKVTVSVIGDLSSVGSVRVYRPKLKGYRR